MCMPRQSKTKRFNKSARTKIAIVHSTMDKMECSSWWTKSLFLSVALLLANPIQTQSIHRIHRRKSECTRISSFNVDIFVVVPLISFVSCAQIFLYGLSLWIRQNEQKRIKKNWNRKKTTTNDIWARTMYSKIEWSRTMPS